MAQVTRRVVCAPYFSDKSVTICMRAPPHGSFKLSMPWLQPLEPKCNIPRCLLTVYKTRLHNYLLYHAICARLKRFLSNQVRCWISRVILRKGGPKLEACFCDCWCFSFLMYFWLLVPLWLDYDELILSLIVLTYVVFMAQTYPPTPPRCFHTQAVALFWHLFHTPTILSHFEYWLDPHSVTLLLWTLVVRAYICRDLLLYARFRLATSMITLYYSCFELLSRRLCWIVCAKCLVVSLFVVCICVVLFPGIHTSALVASRPDFIRTSWLREIFL